MYIVYKFKFEQNIVIEFSTVKMFIYLLSITSGAITLSLEIFTKLCGQNALSAPPLGLRKHIRSKVIQ